MLLNINKFLGQNKFIPDHQLPDGVGVNSVNTFIEDGRLVPFKENKSYNAGKTFNTNSKTIYLHRNINEDVSQWIEFEDFTSIVRHPTGDDQYQRIYYVRDGKLKYNVYLFNSLFFSTYEFDALLPQPNPETQITVNVTNPETINPIRRFIAYTLVNDLGDESALSLASNGTGDFIFGNFLIDNLKELSTVEVTWDSNTIVPAGGEYHGIIKNIRFYMTPTDSTTDTYRFVGEALISAETFTITNAGTDTPLKENIVAPVRLTYDDYSNISLVGVCKTVFGSIVIYDKANVYISEQYKPTTFSALNVYSIESQIKGVFPFGNNIAVFTTTTPYVMTGNSPSSQYIEKAEQARSVSNINCVVNTDDFIIFPTDVGIYVVGTGVFSLATEQLISKQQWDIITNKGSYLFNATHYKDLYLLTLKLNENEYKTLVFDFKRGYFSELDYLTKVSFYDSLSQNLFIFDNTISLNRLLLFNSDTDYKTATVTTGRFILNKPYSLKYLRVLADTYTDNIDVSIYLDGVLVTTITCNSDRIFKLPSRATRECQVTITTNTIIRNVLISDNLQEIQSV